MKPVISNRRSSIQTTAEQKHETSLQSTKQQEMFFLGSKKGLSFKFCIFAIWADLGGHAPLGGLQYFLNI